MVVFPIYYQYAVEEPVLLLCVSMLVGSTFAWFTDSVTSSGNRIVSGKLAVDLLMFKEAENKYVGVGVPNDPKEIDTIILLIIVAKLCKKYYNINISIAPILY